ncbi:NAD(P)/FAD-dependent oxidoreductase [Paractinoplanes ferrugineus]|uniref:Oxidoreductase n=1 Tax=Paractinoplanes ferrugineus TaxID=113564 RepID=A0A919J182_9ACTN|nr:oxidoreductase [Actinoplanes ferrugineus]
MVIGGGAAGLNGALMLARSRRDVLVIDAGQPRNAPADGVHGLLAREGMPPLELIARGQDEVRGYGGEIISDEVTEARRDGDGFAVTTAGGRTVRARRLLVTTGLVDELPDLPGLRERWGRDLVHCPYCHGWEVRDQPIGILATGPASMHHALLFRQLSDDLMFFQHDQPDLPDDQAEQLAARDITLVTGEVAEIQIKDDAIAGVRLKSGSLIPRRVIAVASRLVARAGFLHSLGLVPLPHPSGMGEHLPADATGRTEIPGVWAAGNVTDLSAQVGSAAAAGALAGAQINADLVLAETRLAVANRSR